MTQSTHYVLELGFDIDEVVRNTSGNRVLHQFLYDAQGQFLPAMSFLAGDRLSFHLFDLTGGADGNAVTCVEGHPVRTGQALTYVFHPQDSGDPPSLDNPFMGCTGHKIDQTGALSCTPKLGWARTVAWWGPTGRQQPVTYLDLYVDQMFELVVRRQGALDRYQFSMRLELEERVWSFDPEMIVDGDANPPQGEAPG